MYEVTWLQIICRSQLPRQLCQCGHTGVLTKRLEDPVQMNVQKEEKAQQEVDRLQQEFRKVHNDKNQKVTALTLGLIS